MQLSRPGRARWARLCTRLTLGGALVLAAACSGNSNTNEAAEPVPPTYVKVDNRAYLDMTIYLYRSSQRIRLGMANGNSTTKLLIPASFLFGSTPLRFQADPIGGGRQPISQEISVSAGDEVQLVIPPS